MRIAYYTSYLGKEFIERYGKGKKFALSGPLKSLGIARCMMANGHQVEIFSPGVTTCDAEIPAFAETEVYPEGILTIHYCHIVSKRRRDPINQLRCQSLLWKEHKRHKFDMVVFYNITIGAALIMPKLKNTIKVLEYEDNIFNKSLVGGKSDFDWAKKWMFNRIIHHTDGLMAVCNGLMLPEVEKKILTPGIISEEVIENVSDRLNKIDPRRPVTIILTGGIHYSKGGDLLVGAMQHVKTPTVVRVYGNCNLDERLNTLISKVPKIHKFEFCGYMPHAELIKILDKDADILINTTRSMGVGAQAAGFPFKMMEYASTGRPIVSSEIGRLNDEFNSHITYFDEETRSVAAAIETTIADYDNKAMSALALRKLVLKEYSIQDYLKESDNLSIACKMLRNRIKNIRFLREIALRWRYWRSKRSFINGRNNSVQNYGIKIATRIQIIGEGNTVVIEDKAVVRDCLIKISGNHNKVVIKKNAYIAGAELWVEDNSCRLTVGENTFVGHHSHLACTENNSALTVGDDCMLSSYVQIRTGDSHSILDLDGKRLNRASDVVVSNHCWIGEGAKILKRTFLDSDLIVATGAVVKGTYPSNVIVAGNPAKIIKNNVTWDSRRL